MSKSIIFYVLALILFFLGGTFLAQYSSAEAPNPSGLLLGMGAIVMGIAMLILSNSKAIKGEKKKNNS